MKPYYEDKVVTIYHGDCRDVLPDLEPVGMVCTSPPYLNQRTYELDSFRWSDVVPVALSNVLLASGGQMFVNLGLKHENGRVVQYWNELISKCESRGLRLFGWYVWDQGSGLPGDFQGRLCPSHEWIFHFNRIAQTPNKSVSKLPDSGPMGSNMRSKDGVNGPRSSICTDESKYHDSVFRVGRDFNHGTDHPAVFPVQLASQIINCFPGSVLDPFMGTGTTLRAAKDLNRKAIGIEIEERYCEIAAQRMAQEVLNFA